MYYTQFNEQHSRAQTAILHSLEDPDPIARLQEGFLVFRREISPNDIRTRVVGDI